MARSRRENISAVDTAWLRMDRPHNLMMICGVLMFRERLDMKRLEHMLLERFLVFGRFRKRPVESGGVARWKEDEAFDIRKHLVSATLPPPGGQRELEDLVSALVSTPLDPSRPLWQFHRVDHFDGGSALIVRIHHCYADGIALVRVMLSMTDASRNGPPAMPFDAPRRERKPDADDPLAQLMQPLSGVLDTARRIGSTLLEKGAEIWNDPNKAVALASQGTALTGEIARLATMTQDSPTRFKGKPDVPKRVAWAPPLALDEVKTIGRALGASINDVMLSCVAGALRHYLADRGDPVEGVVVRALVPVNLRPMEHAWRLGNQFGLVFLELPIGIENPVERLYAVRANMRALKDSYQPVVALGILAAMGAGPRMLQETLLQLLARNATAVMTNVPGPQQPLWLAGARIDSLMFWVPQSGDIGMGASILSYDGKVQFGLVSDRGLCPDPELVVARLAPEFEKLVLATLMAPWPREGDLDPGEAEAVLESA